LPDGDFSATLDFMNRTVLFAAVLLTLAAVPASASACDWGSIVPPTPEQERAAAQAAVDRSTAIIEGEVLQAQTRDQPALVRAVRVLKGPVQDVFVIGHSGGCWAIEVGQPGDRVRLLLTGGPNIWYFEESFARPAYVDAVLSGGD
jgi:hypothetical protein